MSLSTMIKTICLSEPHGEYLICIQDNQISIGDRKSVIYRLENVVKMHNRKYDVLVAAVCLLDKYLSIGRIANLRTSIDAIAGACLFCVSEVMTPLTIYQVGEFLNASISNIRHFIDLIKSTLEIKMGNPCVLAIGLLDTVTFLISTTKEQLLDRFYRGYWVLQSSYLYTDQCTRLMVFLVLEYYLKRTYLYQITGYHEYEVESAEDEIDKHVLDVIARLLGLDRCKSTWVLSREIRDYLMSSSLK